MPKRKTTRKTKKWGKAGSPHSAKRKRLLARARKSIKRKYKGYGSKRSFKADRSRRATHRRRSRKKGYGNTGDN